MRQLFFFLFLITLIVSCGDSKDDVSGSSDMAGKLYIINPYDSFPPQVQPAQTVLLQRSADTSPASYLFSATTNAAGEFTFNYLYKDNSYKLHAETRHNTRWDENILFSVDSTLQPAKYLQLNMQPDTVQQNGLYIICLDSVTTTTPGVMPADSIYLYTSSILAIEDSTNIAGEGASYRVVANRNGKALKMNLPFDRPVYINAACTFGGKRYTSKFTKVSLRKSGIDTVWVRMK